MEILPNIIAIIISAYAIYLCLYGFDNQLK